MKSILKFTFVLIVSLCLLPAAESHAAVSEKAAPGILAVDGRGTAVSAPDRASVSIGVTTHAKDAAAAQSENTSRAQSIIAGLKAMGIDAKDIHTSNYSFRPTYSYKENNEQEINGYSVDNTVLVVVRDIHLTGMVIDTALNHGANQINSLDFQISDTGKLRKGALLAAISDAKEKADIIASGLGRRIIGIQQVSENTGSFQSRTYNSKMLAEAAMVTAVPIESGSISLDANVHIEFILSE